MYYEVEPITRLRSDIKFFYSTDGGTTYFDEQIQDFSSLDDLQNLYLISILTDAQISVEEATELGISDTLGRRGFWGDELVGFSIGSKIWTLSRKALTNSVLSDLEKFTSDALAWMITDGIVTTNTVTSTRINNHIFAVDVVSVLTNKNIIKFKFYYDWYTHDVGGNNGIN